MDGLKKKRRSNLPRLDRERIIQEYLIGRKTCAMLGKEYDISRNAVSEMVCRYKQKNSVTFTETINRPIMPRKKNQPVGRHTVFRFFVRSGLERVLPGAGETFADIYET